MGTKGSRRSESRAAAGAARLRVGTSGWQYRHWRGVLYPEHLPVRRWLEHYAARFDTVEINNTFYHLPAAATFDAWRARAPRGFCYALKLSRYATHVRRLREPRAPVTRFLARAARLGRHLGPILVQLPPRWGVDPARLAGFLRVAPRARRWALEFRDPSWLCAPVYELLRAHGAALCVHDLIPGHPREVTADFVYLRFHGTAYGGSYSPQALAAWARRIRAYLERGLDVYAYFNNDRDGWAVVNARALRRYAGGDARGAAPGAIARGRGAPRAAPPRPRRRCRR
jgi:uncharacterized protein YecE (DUF72 family)